MKQQPEYQLQKAVCQYLRAQYPNVMFLSDTIAACKLTIPQQVRNKAIQCEGFKCPDLLILEPRGGYHGLFIELKTETPYKKDGGIKASKNDHLKLQAETLQNLRGKKYLATFAWDFDQIKQMIDDYFIFGQFLPF
jgi:hypothetical protein